MLNATKLLAGILVLVSTTIFLAFNSRVPAKIWLPNEAFVSESFWKGKDNFNVEAPKFRIPYDLPGPADAGWSGSVRKSVTLHVEAQELAKFDKISIDVLESHESAPPTIEIALNDKIFAKKTFNKGGGNPSHLWKKEGKKQKLVADLPQIQREYAGSQSISITSTGGSWLAFEKIEMSSSQNLRSSPLYYLVFLASIIFGWSLKTPRSRVVLASLLIPIFAGSYFASPVLNKNLFYIFFEKDNGTAFVKSIADQIETSIAGDKSIRSKVQAAQKYVSATASPTANLPLYIWDQAYLFGLYGQAFCNDSANFFLQIMSQYKIPGYMTYLKDSKGDSPHSVAFISIEDAGKPLKDSKNLFDQGIVVDTYSDIIYQKKNGSYARSAEICNSHDLKTKGQERFLPLYCNEPTFQLSNKNWFPKNLSSTTLKFLNLPLILRKKLLIYAVGDSIVDDLQKKYLTGRMNQLFFEFEEANRIFHDIREMAPKSPWARFSDHSINQISKFRSKASNDSFVL